MAGTLVLEIFYLLFQQITTRLSIWQFQVTLVGAAERSTSDGAGLDDCCPGTPVILYGPAQTRCFLSGR